MPASFQSIRQTQTQRLIGALARGECCAIVGLSNTGKSPLLRALPALENLAAYQQAAGRPGLLVYIDCNRVVELTAPGFFEIVVRSLVEALEETPSLQPAQTLLNHLREQHNVITTAASTFQASLAFNDAISECCQQLGRNLALLLDEFDEIYAALEDRTLLNLRALKDKFRSRLVYVTATTRPLADSGLRGENEFAELFAANTLALGALSEADAQRALDEMGGAGLSAETRQTVLQAAGGHFGLLGALAHAAQLHPHALASDPNVRAECVKIWNQLRAEEQAAVRALITQEDDGLNPHDRERLAAFGLLTGEGRIFSELFATFVRRQSASPEDAALGVRVDEDAGEVWVEGVKVTVLTDLEYRLMRLLYQRVDRLTTKEMIVETVWGTQYLDRVDDARIEKLVSRLRAKIEPDPVEPRYLLTQRGRGYKLVSRPAEARPDEDEAG
jgi:DNA-binding winged helix-turn-helix (wHTH) protein/GTP-binding protein EngB required for normal cell division